MLSVWQSGEQWITGALAGMAEPWIICVALALTTLLLEDLAIAAGAALATHGTISWELAFVAVAGGIAAGDIALYGLGAAARRVPWLHRKYIAGRSDWARERLHGRLASAILLARVIPGLRLLTYTACGFVRVDLPRFVGWVMLAVTVWTLGLFWLSAAIGTALTTALGIPAPIAVAIPIVVVAIAFPCFQFLKNRIKRVPT